MLNLVGFDNLISYYNLAKEVLNNDNIFFVGGVVRDILLNLKKDNFEDIDITCAGKPSDVFEKLDKTYGSIFKTDKFGTITIVDKKLGCQFEITPFREEGTYSDSRHPDELKWTESLISDSIRRDFTINSLYYAWVGNQESNFGVGRGNGDHKRDFVFDVEVLKLDKGEEKLKKVLKSKGYVVFDESFGNKYSILLVQDYGLIEQILIDGKIQVESIKNLIGDFSGLHLIFDPQKGLQDILNQKIRAVGNPDDRINEDALRIIRGIRFVSILNMYEHINLDFESKTWLAMKKYYFLIRKIAKERVVQEMKKVFKRGNAFGFIGLMDELNILKYYFPALVACKHIDQPTRYHPFDVYAHTLLTLYHLQKMNTDYLVRFGMLYHDVGKPDQYYRASIRKDEASQQELYKLDVNHPVIGSEIAEKEFLQLGFSKKEAKQIAFYVKYHMFPGDLLNMSENKRKKEIKKFISEYGVENLLNLCDITIGDRLGQYNPLQHSNIDGVLNLKEEIKQIYEQSGRITLKELKINGNDIKKLAGGKTGPFIGQILNELLEFVLGDEKRNDRKILLEKAKQLLKI